MGDTIKISWKAVVIFTVIALLLFGTFAAFFARHSSDNQDSTNSGSIEYQNIPEKCRPPVGQDLTSWKEHLSHHAETQECLNYFN